MKIISKILAALTIVVALLATVYAAPAWPNGNFNQTCKRCTFDGKVLSCKCQNDNGRNRWTSMRVGPRCMFVQNVNGNLTCTGKAGRPGRRRITRSAGPIFNQSQANHRCPRVCGRVNRSWNGQWWTVRNGSDSVCQCIR